MRAWIGDPGEKKAQDWDPEGESYQRSERQGRKE